MFYAKWMERLDKMDEDVSRTVRRREYWYILEISGVFMNWGKGQYMMNLVYLAFLFSVLSYYVPCLIVSMFKVDNLAELGQYLNFISLIFISQTTIIVCQIKRKNLIEMFKINSEGFYDYGDSVVSPEVEKVKRFFQLFKRFLLVVLPTWLILIAGSVMVSDYVDAIFAFDTTVTSDYVNGVYQRLPLKMWYFHTIDSEYKRYIFIVSQIICSSSMAMAICSADLLMFFNGQALVVQMRTLVVNIKDTDSRADKMYMKQHGEAPPKDPILRKKNTKLIECYRFCLSQLIEHHLINIRFYELFENLLDWPAGVAIFNGAILVAMSIVSLMQGGGQPSLVFTSLLLVIAEVASLFVMCEIGQTVTDLNEECFDALYEFAWMDCSEEILQNLRIMKIRMARPLVLQAILTNLNRDTFGTMMNTAYSYMNLMRASEQQNMHE